MKMLGFIPARGGSKGIPHKNKKLLCGKPLIMYTIDAAKASALDAIVVSSDDDEILEIADKAGVLTVKRPPIFAGDTAPTIEALNHAVASVPGSFDAVMTLQPTSPLRTTDHINESIALFSGNAAADSLVSIIQAPHKFSNNSLMIKKDDFVEPLEKGELVLRRQDKPVLWGRNGAAIYITRIERIKEYIFGGNILPYEMGKSVSIDIDDMEDWVMAEAMIMHNQNTGNK